MLFVYYEKCSTCRKAKAWLDDHQLVYKTRRIKELPPTEEELKMWLELTKKPIKSYFNTSGLIYREMNLKSKLQDMSLEEQIRLLANNPMLIKRPLIVSENCFLAGFKIDEWKEKLIIES